MSNTDVPNKKPAVVSRLALSSHQSHQNKYNIQQKSGQGSKSSQHRSVLNTSSAATATTAAKKPCRRRIRQQVTHTTTALTVGRVVVKSRWLSERRTALVNRRCERVYAGIHDFGRQGRPQKVRLCTDGNHENLAKRSAARVETE